MGVDWKKEVKLSDLFKRSPKAPKQEAVEIAADTPSQQPVSSEAAPAGEAEPIFVSAQEQNEAAEPEKSGLKKEISLFKRKPKEPKPAAGDNAAPGDVAATVADQPAAPAKAGGSLFKRTPKAPKAPKQGRRGKGAEPAIPLMRAFNLLPKEDARQKTAAKPAPAKLILVAVGVVLLAALALGTLFTNARVNDRRSERDARQVQIDQIQVQIVSITGGQAEAAQRLSAVEQEKQARTAALSTALAPRIAWDRVLRDISLVIPDEVWLQQITAGVSAGVASSSTGAVAAGSFTVTVAGTARSQDGVAQFLSRLQVLPEFSGVALAGSSRTTVSGQDVFQFTINATLKAAGGAIS